MTTKNGIELNLNKSKFIYSYMDYDFYFSSIVYLRKFESRLQEFINLESTKIKNKYKVNIELSLYLAVALYKSIEKRGFYVKNNKMEFLINEMSIFNTKLL